MKRFNTPKPIAPDYDEAEVGRVVGALFLLIVLLAGIWAALP